MKTVFICVNGIRSNPDNQRAWTDEFVPEINLRTPDGVKAEKFEYYCSAVFRWVGQRKRVDELARRIHQYANCGWRVVLVGHSNGCAMIAAVLGLSVKIDSAHLFAPAAYEEDFEIPITKELVRRIHIYGSPDDRALKNASGTSKLLKSRLLKWTGWGYGSLGLRGKAFAEQFPKVVTDHSIAGYDHSTWFIPGRYFAASMELLLKNDAADVKELEGPPTQILP